MKITLLSLFTLALTIATQAQIGIYNIEGENIVDDTITFTHPIDTTVDSPDIHHSGFANVVNESGDTMVIEVTRIEHQIIPGTADYLCWASTCFGAKNAGEETSWNPDDRAEVLPGDTAGGYGIQLYLTTNKKTGIAIYEYSFFDTLGGDFGGASSSFFVKYILSNTTSIDEKKAQQLSFNLYPNPTNNFVNVEFDKSLNQNLSIEVKDILGKQIETIAVPSSAQKMQLDLSSYSKGIYFVSVLDNQQILKTKKLIVK